MNRKELMNFLEKKGLLSPEDSLTMASGKEASSLPLTLSHILIVRDLSEKMKRHSAAASLPPMMKHRR